MIPGRIASGRWRAEEGAEVGALTRTGVLAVTDKAGPGMTVLLAELAHRRVSASPSRAPQFLGGTDFLYV